MTTQPESKVNDIVQASDPMLVGQPESWEERFNEKFFDALYVEDVYSGAIDDIKAFIARELEAQREMIIAEIKRN